MRLAGAAIGLWSLIAAPVPAGGAARSIPASAAQVAVACRLAAGFHRDIRRAALEPDRFASFAWHALPTRASCPRRSIVFRSDRPGIFVTDIAQDGAGRVWALRGGVRYGAFGGGGTDCLYERRAGGFRLIGCARTWVT